MISITTIQNITKETEKAIQFDSGAGLVWVPKSQIVIDEDGVIFAKAWLAHKLGIGPKYASHVLV